MYMYMSCMTLCFVDVSLGWICWISALEMASDDRIASPASCPSPVTTRRLAARSMRTSAEKSEWYVFAMRMPFACASSAFWREKTAIMTLSGPTILESMTKMVVLPTPGLAEMRMWPDCEKIFVSVSTKTGSLVTVGMILMYSSGVGGEGCKTWMAQSTCIQASLARAIMRPISTLSVQNAQRAILYLAGTTTPRMHLTSLLMPVAVCLVAHGCGAKPHTSHFHTKRTDTERSAFTSMKRRGRVVVL